MAFEFKFPDVGEGIHEGKIVKWKVKVGDTVKVDQPLGEIETDKAVVEIPSPKSGTILSLGAPEGGMIKVGDILAVIGETGEKNTVIKQAKPETQKTKKSDEPYTGSVVGFLEEAKEVIKQHPVEQRAATPSGRAQSGIQVMPAVRVLAKKLGIDLAAIKGTGQSGMITQSDVLAAADTTVKPLPVTQSTIAESLQLPSGEIKVTRKYDLWGYVERVPLTGTRKAIASHMVQSFQNTVPVTMMDKIDVTELATIREKEKEVAEKKNIKLTYLPFVVKAVLIALKEHPYLNASMEGTDIVLKKYYNIGIAVDVEDGLLVPVLKRVDQKSIFALAMEINQLSQKARERKIDPMDLKGGTFTITNLGKDGAEYFTPVINYPEAAILGVGTLKEEVVVFEGKATLRNMLPLSLTFDHRIADGAVAARFLSVVKKHLQDPNLMLVEDLV